MLQYESTSLAIELRLIYLDLVSKMVSVVKTIGEKQSHSSSMIVHQLYMWSWWSDKQSLLELLLMSFALVPLILDRVCTRHIMFVDRLLDSLWFLPATEGAFMTRFEYLTMSHEIQSVYGKLMSLSPLQSLQCQCALSMKALCYDLDQLHRNILQESEHIPELVQRWCVTVRYVYDTQIPPIMDSLWTYKQTVITHLEGSSQWYYLSKPWEKEIHIQYPSKKVSCNLRTERWTYSLCIDLHHTFEAVERYAYHTGDHLYWLADLHYYRYQTVITIPNAPITASMLSLIDAMITLVYQALGTQVYRPRTPEDGLWMSMYGALRIRLYDDHLAIVHDVYTVCVGCMTMLLPVHHMVHMTVSECEERVSMSQRCFEIGKSIYVYHMNMIPRILLESDEKGESQPLLSFVYDGIVLGYYWNSNRSTCKLESMFTTQLETVLSGLGQILSSSIFLQCNHNVTMNIMERVLGLVEKVMERMNMARIGSMTMTESQGNTEGDSEKERDSEELSERAMMLQMLSTIYVNGFTELVGDLPRSTSSSSHEHTVSTTASGESSMPSIVEEFMTSLTVLENDLHTSASECDVWYSLSQHRNVRIQCESSHIAVCLQMRMCKVNVLYSLLLRVSLSADTAETIVMDTSVFDNFYDRIGEYWIPMKPVIEQFTHMVSAIYHSCSVH